MKRIIFLLLGSLSLVEVIAQTCGTGTVSDYTPDAYTPIKTVRLNFWFMQKADGTGGFQMSNPEHKKFIDDAIERLNTLYSSVPSFPVGDPCYSENPIPDTRIRWVVENRFSYNSTYYWNNENEVTADGCPGSTWYLNTFNNNYASTATGNNVALNIYFTENQCSYNDIVLNNSVCSTSLTTTSCSQWPVTSMSGNSSVSMRSAFTKFYWMKNEIAGSSAYPGTYWDNTTPTGNANVYAWYANEVGGLIAHELGHSLNLTHEYSCQNFMVGTGTGGGPYINPSQIQIAHQTLELTNMKKYVKENFCAYNASASVTIPTGQNVTWKASRRIAGDLVVKNGAVLNIECSAILTGGAKVIVESGGVLNLKGSGKIVSNCCSSSSSLTYTIAANAQLNVDDNASLVVNSNTTYNVLGKVEIKLAGNLCKQAGSNLNIQPGGQFVYKGGPITSGTSQNFLHASVTNGTYHMTDYITASGSTTVAPTSYIEFKAGKSVLFSPNTLLAPVTGTAILAYVGSPSTCSSVESCQSNLRVAEEEIPENRSISCPPSENIKISGKNKKKMGLTILPNPAQDEVRILFTLTEPEDISIVLFDGMGNKIESVTKGYLEQGQHSFSSDISGLKAGIYYYTVIGKNNLETKRVVKID